MTTTNQTLKVITEYYQLEIRKQEIEKELDRLAKEHPGDYLVAILEWAKDHKDELNHH